MHVPTFWSLRKRNRFRTPEPKEYGGNLIKQNVPVCVYLYAYKLPVWNPLHSSSSRLEAELLGPSATHQDVEGPLVSTLVWAGLSSCLGNKLPPTPYTIIATTMEKEAICFYTKVNSKRQHCVWVAIWNFNVSRLTGPSLEHLACGD